MSNSIRNVSHSSTAIFIFITWMTWMHIYIYVSSHKIKRCVNPSLQIDSKGKTVKNHEHPSTPLCVCVSHLCHLLPFAFLYVISLQLQGETNKQTNNLPFYFLNLNNIIKANPELPFYYHSSKSQQWKVKGKIQEIRMCSFFIPPKMSLNDFFFCYLVNDDKVQQHRKYFYLRKYRIFCWIKSCRRFFSLTVREKLEQNILVLFLC